MAERAAWRPPAYAWAALGAAVLVSVHSRLPWLLQGRWLFVTAIALGALILIAVALWELPPATMMCGAIVLTIFSGSWGNLGLPGFPFLPDRILLLGALLALLLRAPGARRLPRVRVTGVHLLLALTVLYATASAAAVGTLTTKAGVFDLLDRLGALPFLMLLIAPVLFAGPRERNMLLVTLVGLGAYLGATAVFEAIGPHGLVFPRYIWSLDTAVGTGQARGPFSQPVTDGFACYACGVAAMIARAQWRNRWARGVAGAVAVLSMLACVLSLERGIWIGALTGAIVVGIAARDARPRIARATVAAAALIAALLLFAPALASHLTARAGTQRSVWDRKNQTATALRMIAAKPLLGFGWDRYTQDGIDYFRQPSTYPLTGVTNLQPSPGASPRVAANEVQTSRAVPLPLHNSYLSNAVELGLVGCLLWLASLAWALGGAAVRQVSPELRPWKLGLLALTALFFVLAVFDPLQQNFTELLLWTWAGVVVSESP